MRSSTHSIEILPAFEEHGIVYHAAYWEVWPSEDFKRDSTDRCIRDIYTANSPLTALKYVQLSISRKSGILPIDRQWKTKCVFSATAERAGDQRRTIITRLWAAYLKSSASNIEQMKYFGLYKKEVNKGLACSWSGAIAHLRSAMLTANRIA
jgi:hypothetical protein